MDLETQKTVLGLLFLLGYPVLLVVMARSLSRCVWWTTTTTYTDTTESGGSDE